jgi:hypothetical protein
MSDESTPTAPSTRDAIRAKLLGSPAPFKSLLFTPKGFDFQVEIREPTVRKRDDIIRSSGATKVPQKGQPAPDFNQGRLVVEAILKCVYVPGTEDLVFGEADRPALLNQRAGGWVDELGEKVLEVMNIEDAKPKAGTDDEEGSGGGNG